MDKLSLLALVCFVLSFGCWALGQIRRSWYATLSSVVFFGAACLAIGILGSQHADIMGNNGWEWMLFIFGMSSGITILPFGIVMLVWYAAERSKWRLP